MSKITSSILIIGNEILSGRTQDINVQFIAKELSKLGINLSEVRIILKDLLNLSENKVTIDTIQTIVCKFFKISKNEMLSPRRSRYLVRPRQTAIYLAKMLTSKSLPEIGRDF